jgi:NADPH2:quinone reductase
MRALLFDAFGAPDVLRWEEVADPIAGEGEVVVRTEAVGLNFADVYRRRGTYHLSGVAPWVLGYEAAGVVERVGAGVTAFREGDRVGFADVPRANAELVLAKADHLVPLPGDVSSETAAAVLLQGLTAGYLTTDSHAVACGERVLVHAAAGGVGLLLVQLAKRAGATVIGLASTPEKQEAARVMGADQVLGYDGDWVARARACTPGGRGFDVVYDSVGSTLAGSLDAARVAGHVVFYGMGGGDPAPVDPRRLMDESKSLTGGDLWSFLTSASERRVRASTLFEAIRSGSLAVSIAARFPLERGAEAHAYLESRAAIGKVVLTR